MQDVHTSWCQDVDYKIEDNFRRSKQRQKNWSRALTESSGVIGQTGSPNTATCDIWSEFRGSHIEETAFPRKARA